MIRSGIKLSGRRRRTIAVNALKLTTAISQLAGAVTATKTSPTTFVQSASSTNAAPAPAQYRTCMGAAPAVLRVCATHKLVGVPQGTPVEHDGKFVLTSSGSRDFGEITPAFIARADYLNGKTMLWKK